MPCSRTQHGLTRVGISLMNLVGTLQERQNTAGSNSQNLNKTIIIKKTFANESYKF